MKTVLITALAASLAVPGVSLAAHRHQARHVAAKAPARHRQPPLEAKQLAGAWTMTGDARASASCSLKLSDKKVSGGWDLDLSSGCVKAYPRLKDAKAWTIYPDGPALGILNRSRQRIYRFEKTGDRAFVTAPNRDGDQFTLARGAAARDDSDRERKVKAMTPKERMSGGWSLTAEGGASPCHFTSRSNTAGTEGKLTVKPGCARMFRLPYAAWTQKHNRLDLLDAKGKVLSTFRHSDPATWRGQSKSGKVIYFSRD
jgi:hypothetical protein